MDRPTGRVGGSALGFLLTSIAAGVLIAAVLAPAAVAASATVSTGTSTFNALPDYLKIGALDQQTTFYATDNGKQVPIAKFYAQNRIDVPFDKISQATKDAAVATEDPRFYEEGGVDPIGTVRAMLSNASGGSVQGASSITQQYVKNVLVMECELNNPVDASASASEQNKQQAALNACYDSAAGDTIGRKIQEIRYAIGLAKSYTKDQILNGYLNIVGFGGQVYGVQAAAKYYFDTSASTLNLDQAATLVAILNNPSNLRLDESAAENPSNNAKNGFRLTFQRRNYVLQRMLVHKKITKAQYTAAVHQPIKVKITPTDSGCMAAQKYNAGFFCSYVQDVMLSDTTFGKTQADRDQLFEQGGMNVYTTLNLSLNTNSQASINQYIPSTDPNLDLGAANTSVEVGTGRIVTMVENKSYNDTGNAPPGSTSINYSTPYAYGGSSGFQTGSSFKPFDLAAWLEAGHSLYDIVNASNHDYDLSQFPASCTDVGAGPFTVANDEGSETGLMTVLQGTEDSVNTVFMTMAEQLDLCNIADVAHKMGIDSSDPGLYPWSITPTMVIGTNIVSPLQMATAYAGIANNGIVCTPIAIDKIVTTDGKNVPVPHTQCSQGMPADIANGVSWALQHVMTNGTATSADPNDGTQIMGKTGTTDNAVQNWLVTSTTKVAQATWVGNVNGQTSLYSQFFGPYSSIVGNNVKFNIVKPILAALDKAYPAPPLPVPSNSVIYGSQTYTPPPTMPPTPTSAPSKTAGNPAPPSPSRSSSPSTSPSSKPSVSTSPSTRPSASQSPSQKPNPGATTATTP